MQMQPYPVAAHMHQSFTGSAPVIVQATVVQASTLPMANAHALTPGVPGEAVPAVATAASATAAPAAAAPVTAVPVQGQVVQAQAVVETTSSAAV